MTVSLEYAPANSVPAAAVIRRVLALFGFIGRKGRVGISKSIVKAPRLNREIAVETAGLEGIRGEWNSWCNGGMYRYQEEHPWRRRLTGMHLTLRRES